MQFRLFAAAQKQFLNILKNEKSEQLLLQQRHFENQNNLSYKPRDI
jgi:hypothetical protein